MDNNKNKLESLLSELVGDNVGSDCDCSGCESNRQEIRDEVEILISDRTAELQAKVLELTEENTELRKQVPMKK